MTGLPEGPLLPTAELRAPGDAPPPPAPTVRRVAFCPVCRANVRVPGVPCDNCRPAYIRQTREALLLPARATLPAYFARARFSEPRLPEWVERPGAIDEARAALDAPRVVLVGPAGRGKTSLAVAMAHAILEAALAPDCTAEAWRRAQGLRFISAYDLGRSASQHGLGEGKPALVVAALGASMLILDDLGAEDSRLLNSPVPDVIYDRHARAELQTVITTGFGEEHLRGRYGDGITRRIFEHAVLISTTAETLLPDNLCRKLDQDRICPHIANSPIESAGRERRAPWITTTRGQARPRRSRPTRSHHQRAATRGGQGASGPSALARSASSE